MRWMERWSYFISGHAIGLGIGGLLESPGRPLALGCLASGLFVLSVTFFCPIRPNHLP
jgi:hypothetical protein